MPTTWQSILPAIVVLLILVFLALAGMRKNARPIDYRTLLILGCIWLALSLPAKNYLLTLVGIIYIIFALVNKKHWCEVDKTKWQKMSKDQRAYQAMAMFGLVAILLMGMASVFLIK